MQKYKNVDLELKIDAELKLPRQATRVVGRAEARGANLSDYEKILIKNSEMTKYGKRQKRLIEDNSS